jgi:hypothetical protein
MPIRKKTGSNKRVSAKFVIGRERFTQISAVEGIKPTGLATLAVLSRAE